MKLLTKDTDYAIRALLVLALNKDRFVSVRTISKEQGIPYPFLRRLMQKLIQNGLVEAKEGVAGGVRIVKLPQNISMLQLMRIFQGEMTLSDCMFRKKICSNRRKCVLRAEIQRIEQGLSREFEILTLQKLLDLLKEAKR